MMMKNVSAITQEAGTELAKIKDVAFVSVIHSVERMMLRKGDLKMNGKHLLWIVPLALLVGAYAGAWTLGHYQQDFFKLGVDAGNYCNTLYNNEYIKNYPLFKTELYYKCIYDYPEVLDADLYILEIVEDVREGGTE